MQLFMQFIHLHSRFLQRALPRRRNPVEPAASPFNALQARFHQSGALQPMHQRIQSPRSHSVSVVFKLVHHGQAEDGLMRRMQQHVQPNQPIE